MLVFARRQWVLEVEPGLSWLKLDARARPGACAAGAREPGATINIVGGEAAELFVRQLIF